jgi:hypothetical protein
MADLLCSFCSYDAVAAWKRADEAIGKCKPISRPKPTAGGIYCSNDRSQFLSTDAFKDRFVLSLFLLLLSLLLKSLSFFPLYSFGSFLTFLSGQCNVQWWFQRMIVCVIRMIVVVVRNIGVGLSLLFQEKMSPRTTLRSIQVCRIRSSKFGFVFGVIVILLYMRFDT